MIKLEIFVIINDGGKIIIAQRNLAHFLLELSINLFRADIPALHYYFRIQIFLILLSVLRYLPPMSGFDFFYFTFPFNLLFNWLTFPAFSKPLWWEWYFRLDPFLDQSLINPNAWPWPYPFSIFSWPSKEEEKANIDEMDYWCSEFQPFSSCAWVVSGFAT